MAAPRGPHPAQYRIRPSHSVMTKNLACEVFSRLPIKAQRFGRMYPKTPQRHWQDALKAVVFFGSFDDGPFTAWPCNQRRQHSNGSTSATAAANTLSVVCAAPLCSGAVQQLKTSIGERDVALPHKRCSRCCCAEGHDWPSSPPSKFNASSKTLPQRFQTVSHTSAHSSIGASRTRPVDVRTLLLKSQEHHRANGLRRNQS